METKLNLISEVARKDGKCKFNNLAHMLNVGNLISCFRELKRDKASGIDGVTFGEYEKNLEDNITDLVERMKMQSYKPQPVRRVYIPKAKGKLRPLGIPAVEDKIVQMGITKILVAIFEQDFLDSSHGFRPNRSCHDALKALNNMILQRPVNHVIDADIKGFFDNVDHKRLMECLKMRIDDKNLLRLIVRFLKAGVMEAGKFTSSDKGTPQGGIISPVLANIYLHYVLDVWIEKVAKQKCRGYIGVVRYCDDFIVCLQRKEEAESVLEMLKERLLKVGLELSEEKTRLIEFGRYAVENSRRKGQRAESFNFLGFTHYCGKNRAGNFKVGRTTDSKKFSVKMKEMNNWLKTVRNHIKVRYWWPTLCSKMRGHFQYYGVSGNSKGINRYYYLSRRLIFKWLNRRSQKKSFNWEKFHKYLERFPLPKPKIYHKLYTLYGY